MPSPAPSPRASKLGRSVLLVSLGILTSKAAGFFRQRVFAHYFGNGLVADAFNVAVRVPNLIQNLLGEGVLSASFIPVYAQALHRDEAERASRFARDVLGALLLITASASLLGAIFAGPLTSVLALGFRGERHDLTVQLMRILFPMTAMLSLSAWGLGVLNSHRRFFLPYAAPVIWSICQILAMWLGSFSASGERLAILLSYGALLGSVLQFAVQLPAVRGLIGSLRPQLDLENPDLRRAARAFVPVFLGRGVVQISAWMDTNLASLLPGVGGPAILGYVQTIYTLPVSLLGVGVAAATLPEMARQAGDGEAGRVALRAQLGEQLTRVGFSTLPTSLLFLALPVPIVGALFQTGQFDRASTLAVAPALAAAGLGLVANAGVRLLATAHYAIGDTATPAWMAGLRVALAIGLSYLLMQRFGVVGLTAGSAIGAWIEAALLGIGARRRLGPIPVSASRWVRMLGAAVLAGAAGRGVAQLLPDAWLKLQAAVAVAAFGLVYLGAAWLLGLPEVRDLQALIRRRLGR